MTLRKRQHGDHDPSTSLAHGLAGAACALIGAWLGGSTEARPRQGQQLEIPSALVETLFRQSSAGQSRRLSPEISSDAEQTPRGAHMVSLATTDSARTGSLASSITDITEAPAAQSPRSDRNFSPARPGVVEAQPLNGSRSDVTEAPAGQSPQGASSITPATGPR